MTLLRHAACRNGSFTEVENSWPHASHDQKWRTLPLLTNSDADGANCRSWHLGQTGRAKRRDATVAICVSARPLMKSSSALHPSVENPVQLCNLPAVRGDSVARR